MPDSLKSKLLLPYLSEKAKSLLLRLDLAKQEKYSEVKSFLLNEFKLTPMQFKERFDRAARNKDETCTMFCSRLKNLLTYYCNSRQVKESYHILFSLLIADKIKATLPEACLDHILTAEGNAWLECDTLANTIDIYFANHTSEGRPRFVRSDFRNRTSNTSEHPNKTSQANPVVTNERGASGVSALVTGPRESGFAKTGNPSQSASKSGLCYTCHSPGHRQINCPMRRANEGRTGDARVATRNFACAVEAPRHSTETTPSSRLNDSDGRSHAEYNRTNNSIQSDNDGSTPTTQGGYTPPSVKNNAKPVTTIQSTSTATHRADNATTLQSARTMLAECNEAGIQDLISNGLSKLNYVPVHIQGIDHVQYALNDSGSEINLIRRNLVQTIESTTI